jgi:mannose-6-phosphate isomerase-like protein (cupin superfamily)
MQLHDEHITVIEGCISVTVEGRTRMVRAGDDTIVIPRRSWHTIESFKGVKTVIQEVPDPRGQQKAL